MKKKKTDFALVVALGIVALFLWGVVNLSIPLSIPKDKKVDKWLREDYKHLELVVDYLLADPSDYIFFTDGSGCVYDGYPKKVKDDAVQTSVKCLFEKRHYKRIIKTGNTVRFMRWTRLSDYEAGICYSSNGAPMIEFLTATTPLSYDGWYYYEADYNEWRRNN